MKPLLVASHPRSGTHLVIDTIRRQFLSTKSWRWWGLPTDHLYLNLERLCSPNRPFSEDLASRIVARPRRALMKTHFLADFSESWVAEESHPLAEKWAAYAAGALTIYVVRHPLDTMASYKQFLSPFVAGVRQMTLRAFMESAHWSGSVDRLGWWKMHIAGWLRRPNVIRLRYEDLVGNPDAELQRLSALLQEPVRMKMPLLPPKVTSIAQARMARILWLEPASTGIIADRKRFPPSNWRRELDTQDLSWVERRLGPALVGLGYEL